VFGATINLTGAFQMRTTKVGQDTVLAQIVRLVSDAQGNKAPIQKLADRVSGIFCPGVLGIALATAIGWYLATGDVSQSFVPLLRVLAYRLPLLTRSRDADGHHGRHRRRCARGILIKMARRWSVAARSTSWSSTKTAR